MDSQAQNIDINALAQQVIRQGQILENLAASNQATASPTGSVSLQPSLHDLPIRPSYVWQHDPVLQERVPTLANLIFSQTLTDEEKKNHRGSLSCDSRHQIHTSGYLTGSG